MKKIALLLLVLLLSSSVSGCLQETSAGNQAADASLLKLKDKRDNFTLDKATDQNNNAFDFAFSKKDLLADDPFVNAMEAAKAAQEAEATASSGQFSSDTGSALTQATASELVSSYSNLTNSVANTYSNTGSQIVGAYKSFLNNLTPSGSGTGNSLGSGGSSGGSASGAATAPPAPTQADLDHQALLADYAQFQTDQAIADPIIAQVNANPWLARDVLIPDQSLTNLFSSSHTIFNFIAAHPKVAEGDKVLSSVGDTLTSIYIIWGLGRQEAQTAFLMVESYYPGGSYVSHAEQQLLQL